jgi:hypothetical protein
MGMPKIPIFMYSQYYAKVELESSTWKVRTKALDGFQGPANQDTYTQE